MNSIIYENEIILYWVLPDGFRQGDTYCLCVDGKQEKTSDKTHFRLEKLKEDTDYSIRVEWVDKDGNLKGILEDNTYTTNSKKRRIDVSKEPYLAKVDGKTLVTDAIQKAIDDCGDGECVYFPEGTYLTGSLNLHSNMEIYLEKGAVIKGSVNAEDYLPKRASRFEGYEMMCYSSLINMGEMDHTKGYNCKNVVIRGEGSISGGGKELRENILSVERERLKEYMESLGDEIKTYENLDTIPGRTRPRLVNISNCQNVVISNITMEYGPAWNVHMIYSDNVVTHGCTIRSKGVSNGDGWNPDSSTNCTIFATRFDTGDDMIAIKSGKNPEGNKIARPSENINIFDCTGIGNSCAIGSEMSGGVLGVHIWDCDFKDVLGGLTIKATPERGGYIKNVKMENCVISSIRVYSKVGYNNDGEASPNIPVFENFEFNNLTIRGIYGDCVTREYKNGTAIYLSGFEKKGHKLKNVSFKNIYLPKHDDGSEQFIRMVACEGLSFENIVCE